MMRLESLMPGVRVQGIVGEPVEVLRTQWEYDNLVVTYRLPGGQTDEAILTEDDVESLTPFVSGDAHGQADVDGWKIAVEALRLQHAALIDPMLAVSSSSLQPLPHQIKAVYGEFLPRTPLRYLLADDPGAGKTIMCGLYVKEMLLRRELSRCLIVVPGGLSEQWSQELWDKFGLNFTVLTRELISTTVTESVFNDHPLLIARMDMLSRDEELQSLLEESDWDLVVVDEAHRMSAQGTTSESKKTKRYELGEVLAGSTRNFLLMTATPHSGDPERFQAFLALLDSDRFGSHRVQETARPGTDLMRRLLKEELLTMDGRRLFPERKAQTVPYPLGPDERRLYDAVTAYVRDEMNRAEELRSGQRRTVTFALMVLQRRLASSPEAILRSLERRRARLLDKRPDFVAGTNDPDTLSIIRDEDERSLADIEQQEHEPFVDGATAAQSLAQLDVEIAMLGDLIVLAQQVRAAGTDAKWNELETLILQPSYGTSGQRQKLIVFTEFRDTLQYLRDRLEALAGWDQNVVEIHGGLPRDARLNVQRTFATDPSTTVLLATDAAGEGLNLQVANLMVNYDLPWNPNRLEQRFGRIHRIGQTEVCYLWNLVATDTLEGDVYQRLLVKMAEQEKSLQGKVFDVLGDAFAANTPLKELLTRAVRYGQDPKVRAQLTTVIDATINNDVPDLVRERARYTDVLQQVDLEQARDRAENGAAVAIQPHYSGPWLRAALPTVGGALRSRPGGRVDVTLVPSAVKEGAAKVDGSSIRSVYNDVSLDRRGANGSAAGETIGPGHPLFEGLIVAAVDHHSPTLREVAVLVDPACDAPHGRTFVAASHEIVDGSAAATPLSRRFEFVEIDEQGASPAGPAYLNYRAPLGGEIDAVSRSIEAVGGLEAVRARAEEWMNRTLVTEHRLEVDASHSRTMTRMREEVTSSLKQEARYWDGIAQAGGRGSVSGPTARRRANNARERLAAREAAFPGEERVVTRRPRLHAVALVLPAGLLPTSAPTSANPTFTPHVATATLLDRYGVTLAGEGTGRLLTVVNQDGGRERWLRADEPADEDVVISRTDVIAGLNIGTEFKLLLVSADGTARVVLRPFDRIRIDTLSDHAFDLPWRTLWRAGVEPS
ncbi:helicase-related protein [Nocardioides ultimimeridianus]